MPTERNLVGEAVAALNASDFSGQVAPDTYLSRIVVGEWKPFGFSPVKYTGGDFNPTGTRKELSAAREAAANLADDHSVKFVSLETESRLLRFKGPLLTVKREQGGEIVTDYIPLDEGGFTLNGHRKLVEAVLRGVPQAVQRKP